MSFTEGKSSLYIHKEKDITVIEFLEVRMLDDTNINRMAAELTALVDKTTDLRFIIDFSNIKYMSSKVLGKIIALHKQISKRKGTLKLCGLNKDMLEVFKIMKLDKILEIHKDFKRAINSYH
ncbi:STAS domain-containing protein [Planctomycetota bacterium]